MRASFRLLLASVMTGGALAETPSPHAIPDVPAGYTLQSYDDLGVKGRQPHFTNDTYYTFPSGQVEADERARTVISHPTEVVAVWDDLAASSPYVLAVTYASEKGNRRVQSLWAGHVLLHGPRALADGKSERLLFNLPSEAIQGGRLVLRFTRQEGHNAIVSLVELWSALPAPRMLHLDLTPRVTGDLDGIVSALDFRGVPGAQVRVRNPEAGGEKIATTKADGSFRVNVSDWAKPGRSETLKVTAELDGLCATNIVGLSNLWLELPRFRPLPATVAGLDSAQIVLDGHWRLHASPPENFPAGLCEGHGWSHFEVPGQWLQQGYDVPRDKAVGLATRFKVPAAWAGRRLFLRFDAVHGGADYWLNGHHLGYSENLATPVEFDVTGIVHHDDDNLLALSITVETVSERIAYMSNYAFHNLGGIPRSVRLFALPPLHVSRFHVDPRLDAECRDAVLALQIAVQNDSGATQPDVSLELALERPDGKAVGISPSSIPTNSQQVGLAVPSEPPVRARRGEDTAPYQSQQKPSKRNFSIRQIVSLTDLATGATNLTWQIPVANPLKWSAEQPHLYKLTATLRQRGKVVQTLEERVGFRKVETRDRQLWVNGRMVKLAGVNRHEIDPVTGRADTVRHAEQDARLLREANFNYIRTSHYPPTREFLAACDRLGIYVQVEAPFTWTRNRGEDDGALVRHFLIPTAAMLDYHRNHPSVIMWSIANESGSVPDGENRLPENFTAMLNLCHSQDPSRPVIFSNEWARDGGLCDIAAVHYPPFPAEEYKFVKDDPRPILLDEYFPPQTFTFAEELNLNPGLDIVNWSTGQNSSTSYWSQICASKRIIGGAIWAGIDEEFFFRDGSVRGYGPWGFLDVWRRKKSLWWDAKRIHSPVWIPVRRLEWSAGQTVVKVPVENRYSFTDLKELGARWTVAGKTGRAKLALPPQSSGALNLSLPRGVTNGPLLVLEFFDPAGDLITSHGITLGDAPTPAIPRPQAGCPTWRDTGDVIEVQGNNFHFAINKTTGEFSKDKSTLALRRFPSLWVTRKESKNVFNPGGAPYAQFPDETTRVIESISAEQRGDALAIILRDRYKDFSGAIELLTDRQGQCAVSLRYTYSGKPFDLSELGLRFAMDNDCREIRWKRQTEWDVYPADHIGRPEGWARARRDAECGQPLPMPPLSPPTWPWHLDENEFGTRDFRATKYNIHHASLLAPNGSGIAAFAAGDANVRACLSKDGVQFHTVVSAVPEQLTRTNFTAAFSIRIFAE